nr:MAG TPA: hypothetical protein [Caudoviricetes sp.]
MYAVDLKPVRIPPAQPKSNLQQTACLYGLLRVFFL